ncbi:MAG: DUF2490 domain-containing protein [Bacteroidales bacterium]|nr:DUF2490 domain-containing protein [Bacteroidales bacterium]
MLPLLLGLQIHSHSQEVRFGGALDMAVTNDFAWEFEGEIRATEQLSRFETALLETSISYELGDHFQVKSGYRHYFISSNVIPTGSPDDQKDRITTSFYAEKELVEDLNVQYRIRYQWQKEIDASEINSRQYLRNRLEFDYNLTSIADPYISGEFYYRIDEEYQVQQWRLEFGLDIELTDDLDMDVFYRHERDVNVLLRDIDRIIEVNLQYNLEW